MDTPATPLPFRITTDGAKGVIEVDGIDVADRVVGIEFVAGFGEHPKLVLHRAPGAGEIDGEAIVHVVDPEASAAAAVRALDPAVITEKMRTAELSMADSFEVAVQNVIADLLEAG